MRPTTWPGCGDSDHPDPAGLGADAYGPSAMARQVLSAVRQRLAARPAPPRVTLVGHSLGGSTVLRRSADPAVRREFADVLSRVDGWSCSRRRT